LYWRPLSSERTMWDSQPMESATSIIEKVISPQWSKSVPGWRKIPHNV
jgi:hypothetical protein